MGIFSGFFKVATGIITWIGRETIKGAIVESVADELIIEPALRNIKKKLQDNKLGDEAYASLRQTVSSVSIDEKIIDGVKDKIKLIDDKLKKDDSIIKKILDKVTRQGKKQGRHAAKALMDEYKSSLNAVDTESFIANLMRGTEWNKNGECERITVAIFNVYIKTLPELLFSHLPEEYQYTIKILQSELESIKDTCAESAQAAIEVVQIFRQQHMPVAALSEPEAVKSPFAFIRRVCPTCGYDGEYLYYNKKDQTVFCSACSTTYDIERDSGKGDEIKGLINQVQANIVQKMQSGQEQQKTAFAELGREIAATTDAVRGLDDKMSYNKDLLNSIAEKAARHFVLQSAQMDKLMKAASAKEGEENKYAEELKKEFDKLDIQLDHIKSSLENGTINVDRCVADINYFVDVRSSEIVAKIEQEHQKTLDKLQKEHKRTQNKLDELSEDVREIRDGIERMSTSELETKLNNAIAKQKRSPSPRSNARYLCPVCFTKAYRTDKECSYCGAKFGAEHIHKLEIEGASECKNARETVELAAKKARIKCVLKWRTIDTDKTIAMINVPPNNEFDKMAFKLSDNLKDGTLIINSVECVPNNTSNGDCAFDKLKRLVVLTNDGIAEQLECKHFTTVNFSGVLYIVTNSRVLKKERN